MVVTFPRQTVDPQTAEHLVRVVDARIDRAY
jgi:hypothetical protein